MTHPPRPQEDQASGSAGAPAGPAAGGPWRRGAYVISTDRGRLDVAAIHAYLVRSYWAEGIPLEVVARALDHSLCFGLYHVAAAASPGEGVPVGAPLVGFCRWITDRATYAYLGDVYVLEDHRGRGLGSWLVEVACAHPDVQGHRRWSLLTRDAHALYERFGFVPLADPRRWMEKRDPEVYKRPR